MPKFSAGDRVIHQDRLATIVDVNLYLGKRKVIWYSVKYDGTTVPYFVPQKDSSLRKAKATA